MMEKWFAYGFTAVATLALLSVLGTASLSTVYNPVEGENVPIDRVSMDDLTSWVSYSSFAKWNDMSELRSYLQEQGTSLEELRERASEMSRKELLSLSGRKEIVKEYTAYTSDADALQEVECDPDDRRVEFELTNTGVRPWFLISQEFTSTRRGDEMRKRLSDSLRSAEAVSVFVNDYLANSKLPRYHMGERIFTEQGQTFAQACQADFLRPGNTVSCELEPVPLRSGMAVDNSIELNAPSVKERVEFECA